MIPSEFTEKEFYLEEFRGRTLLCAVHHEGDPGALRALADVARELIANGSRVVVVAAGSRMDDDAVRAALTTAPPANQPRMLTLPSGEPTLPVLAEVWAQLRAHPLLAARTEAASVAALLDATRPLAARLRVTKLVVLDAAGGLCHPENGRLISFANAPVRAQLVADGRMAARHALLAAIERTLADGIEAVNVCTLESVARELFTYEGAGTLCTRGDYCRVTRLGIDDFAEVEKLLERGHREGFLKERSRAEVAEVLFEGFGATVGERHLAGVCALRTAPYADERAGEIVGLYTLTRFKGEGVGITLVASMQREARERGLAYLFACTTEGRVGAFFERQGFRRVAPADVPAGKWDGYEAARRERVQVFRLDLELSFG